MHNKEQHIINKSDQARVALKSLDVLEDNVSRTLFVINDELQLVGSLTDGDIRRGLLNGLEISQPIEIFMNTNFKYLKNAENNLVLIKEFRDEGINLIPVIDDSFRLLEVLDSKFSASFSTKKEGNGCGWPDDNI